MGWVSSIKEKVSSTYSSFDTAVGGYLPGGKTPSQVKTEKVTDSDISKKKKKISYKPPTSKKQITGKVSEIVTRDKPTQKLEKKEYSVSIIPTGIGGGTQVHKRIIDGEEQITKTITTRIEDGKEKKYVRDYEQEARDRYGLPKTADPYKYEKLRQTLREEQLRLREKYYPEETTTRFIPTDENLAYQTTGIPETDTERKLDWSKLFEMEDVGGGILGFGKQLTGFGERTREVYTQTTPLIQVLEKQMEQETAPEKYDIKIDKEKVLIPTDITQIPAEEFSLEVIGMRDYYKKDITKETIDEFSGVAEKYGGRLLTQQSLTADTTTELFKRHPIAMPEHFQFTEMAEDVTYRTEEFKQKELMKDIGFFAGTTLLTAGLGTGLAALPAYSKLTFLTSPATQNILRTAFVGGVALETGMAIKEYEDKPIKSTMRLRRMGAITGGYLTGARWLKTTHADPFGIRERMHEAKIKQLEQQYLKEKYTEHWDERAFGVGKVEMYPEEVQKTLLQQQTIPHKYEGGIRIYEPKAHIELGKQKQIIIDYIKYQKQLYPKEVSVRDILNIADDIPKVTKYKYVQTTLKDPFISIPTTKAVSTYVAPDEVARLYTFVEPITPIIKTIQTYQFQNIATPLKSVIKPISTMISTSTVTTIPPIFMPEIETKQDIMTMGMLEEIQEEKYEMINISLLDNVLDLKHSMTLLPKTKSDMALETINFEETKHKVAQVTAQESVLEPITDLEFPFPPMPQQPIGIKPIKPTRPSKPIKPTPIIPSYINFKIPWWRTGKPEKKKKKKKDLLGLQTAYRPSLRGMWYGGVAKEKDVLGLQTGISPRKVKTAAIEKRVKAFLR